MGGTVWLVPVKPTDKHAKTSACSRAALSRSTGTVATHKCPELALIGAGSGGGGRLRLLCGNGQDG